MDSNTVVIEHCRNCKQHQWNTRHNEQRYTSLFAEFKAALQKNGMKVEQSSKHRLGAFEISMNGITLFSKFKSQMFPDVHPMMQLILQFREEYKDEAKRPDTLKKYSDVVVKQQETDRQQTQQSMRDSHLRNNRNSKYNQFFSSRRFSQPFIETFHSRISGGSSLSNRLNNSVVEKKNFNRSPARDMLRTTTQKMETIELQTEPKREPKHEVKHEQAKEVKKQEDHQNPEKAQPAKTLPKEDAPQPPQEKHESAPEKQEQQPEAVPAA